MSASTTPSGSPTKSPFRVAGREHIDVPMDRDELSLSATLSPSPELERVKQILQDAVTAKEAAGILQQEFCEDGLWGSSALARIVRAGLRAGRTLEDLRKQFGVVSKPFALPTISRDDMRDRKAWAARNLSHLLLNRGQQPKPPLAPALPAAPVAQAVPTTPEALPVQAVQVPVEQDSNLDRLLKMRREDFEYWVRRVFTPYMQEHFEIFKRPEYSIQPKWVPESMGVPAVRGIVMGGDKKGVHSSEITLKENSISIAYQSTNHQADARSLAMQFAGVLFAGRPDKSKPVLLISSENFSFSNEIERQSKAAFFKAIKFEFENVGLGYELPSGELSGPIWDEIISWTQPRQDPQRENTATAFRKAMQMGRCRIENQGARDAQASTWPSHVI